jgi:hypothetical protein
VTQILSVHILKFSKVNCLDWIMNKVNFEFIKLNIQFFKNFDDHNIILVYLFKILTLMIKLFPKEIILYLLKFKVLKQGTSKYYSC